MIEVLTDPVVLERVEDEGSLPIRWLVLGTDRGGRAIELIVLEERTKVVVIHAMDLRKKYRARYERGLTLGGETLEDKS